MPRRINKKSIPIKNKTYGFCNFINHLLLILSISLISVFVYSFIATIFDPHQYEWKCCCNIDIAHEYFVYSNIDDPYTNDYKNNSFCIWNKRNNSASFGYQIIVRDVLKHFNYTKSEYKIYRFLSGNLYCNSLLRDNRYQKYFSSNFIDDSCYSLYVITD